MEKILIGGQALRELGSSRYTSDTDYLIFDENDFSQFIFDRENNIDYMNGNGSNFSEEIYKKEKGNKIASPQSLFELKAFALISYLRDFNKEKINSSLFDLNFLNEKFEINTNCPILSKFATNIEIEEIKIMLI